MENRKLEVYTFTAHPNRKPNENVTLENVYGSDLYKKLKDKFANYVDTFPPININRKTIKIEKEKKNRTIKSVFKSDDTLRYISGKIKIGDGSYNMTFRLKYLIYECLMSWCNLCPVNKSST